MRQLRWALIPALFLFVLAAASACSASALDLTRFIPCVEGQFYTILNEQGETVAKMALSVSVGDYLITEDNRGYEVVSVRGRVARARFDKWVDLEQAVDRPPLKERLSVWVGGLLAQARGGDRTPEIGLYHTHSDESYAPGGGKASEPTGDIYRVGAALRESLERNGFRVSQSYNNHNPHDGAAYHRSRRTAADLLKSQPAALLDIHRDAIPDPNYYRKQVAGETIAQVRLVVGKQNQNRAVNFDFAKRLKAEANRKYPGLVKEIYWAKGNYNQDLAPRAILLEFGTHTNSEEMARRGASLMANVLPVVLTGRATATPSPQPHGRVARLQNRSSGRSALWIALAVIGGTGLFLALNAGKLGGSFGRQLKKFTSQELSGFLGRYRGRAKGKESDRRGKDRSDPAEPGGEDRPRTD